MTTAQIIDMLKARFTDVVESAELTGTHPHVVVRSSAIVDVCTYLRDEPSLRFDFLRCITAIDLPDSNKLAVSYDLVSIDHAHCIAVKVELDRDNPRIDTVSGIWPAGDWHEREAYDLMGVTFVGHKELLRILMPEDWPGHPLRKDYQQTDDYHGITTSL